MVFSKARYSSLQHLPSEIIETLNTVLINGQNENKARTNLAGRHMKVKNYKCSALTTIIIICDNTLRNNVILL